MKVDVRLIMRRNSLALQRFAEHSLRRKLGTLALRVRRAQMSLRDVNGPRGGVDKTCRIRLSLAGGGDLCVAGEAAGWYEAVTIAAMNARTAVARRRGRVRSRRPSELERRTPPGVGAETNGRNIA